MRKSSMAVITSTGKDDWETPKEFYDALDAEFQFTLDVCATSENAKCTRYFTPEDDGLQKDWAGETAFCNPPYSNRAQDKWVEKCFMESRKPNTTVVALLPARTDTARFHRYILHKAEIRFVRGRIKFVGASAGAPFPSMVVIWKQNSQEGDTE